MTRSPEDRRIKTVIAFLTQLDAGAPIIEKFAESTPDSAVEEIQILRQKPEESKFPQDNRPSLNSQ